jgi:putative DNA primase/helicase
MERINEFCESMAANGLQCPDTIVSDGVLHRFNVNGDKPGNKNGWYVFYGNDGLPAGAFGNWKLNQTFTWCEKSEKSLSDTERAKWQERIAKAKKARDQELKRIHSEARKKAAWIWENSKPVKDYPYLVAKGVKSHGLRLHKDSLVIPIRDVDEIIRGLQFISADGGKNFLTGSAIVSHFYPIDGDGDTLLVCEGYATGASLHEATGYPVVVAFNAGNLKAVAEVLRKKSPGTIIIICGDDDFETDGNPGLTKAKEAAESVVAAFVIPKFKDQARRGTDFNDLHQEEGLGAVRHQIEKALKIPPASQDETISSDVANKTPEYLASLPFFEYEQQRQSMADKLGVRVSILDKEV